MAADPPLTTPLLQRSPKRVDSFTFVKNSTIYVFWYCFSDSSSEISPTFTCHKCGTALPIRRYLEGVKFTSTPRMRIHCVPLQVSNVPRPACSQK